jgi:hypothetical protein
MTLSSIIHSFNVGIPEIREPIEWISEIPTALDIALRLGGAVEVTRPGRGHRLMFWTRNLRPPLKRASNLFPEMIFFTKPTPKDGCRITVPSA